MLSSIACTDLFIDLPLLHCKLDAQCQRPEKRPDLDSSSLTCKFSSLLLFLNFIPFVFQLGWHSTWPPKLFCVILTSKNGISQSPVQSQLISSATPGTYHTKWIVYHVLAVVYHSIASPLFNQSNLTLACAKTGHEINPGSMWQLSHKHTGRRHADTEENGVFLGRKRTKNVMC